MTKEQKAGILEAIKTLVEEEGFLTLAVQKAGQFVGDQALMNNQKIVRECVEKLRVLVVAATVDK